MADGFLGRWARRKEAGAQGRAAAGGARAHDPAPGACDRGCTRGGGATPRASPADPAEPPAAPTLQDAQELTPQSDFTRFVQPDVPPEVKNAAMKKLFADPHFNVMDGLDIYIDDYNKPDPIPRRCCGNSQRQVPQALR
jgi:hypothetical protein